YSFRHGELIATVDEMKIPRKKNYIDANTSLQCENEPELRCINQMKNNFLIFFFNFATFKIFPICFLIDGMKGYLTPCSGETHSPIFRSLIYGMEDILTNQVI
ncbi:unnamed protein product, partial [Brassica rapa subsp. trilocularis]